MTTDVQQYMQMAFENLALSIGGTPLLAIQCEFRGKPRRVFAKSENLNLTGSIKDRVALHVLRTAYEAGAIQPGQEIVGVSGDNTGIAFSAIGRALGHNVTILMPAWKSEERINLLRRFGATIVPAHLEECGLLGSIAGGDEIAEHEGNVFLPHQFSKRANSEVHALSTGPEVWFQLKTRGLIPNAFVAGVGSGGTLTGVGQFLRSKDPSVQVHPLEPMESPTVSTGCTVGNHRIHGISGEIPPDIPELDSLGSVIQVSDGDAIRMARALGGQLGLGVGISSGANFLGALLVQEELGPDAVVVTVFSDDNKRYLSTDLSGDEPIKDDFISPEVELLGYSTVRRSCRACSDLDECQHWVS